MKGTHCCNIPRFIKGFRHLRPWPTYTKTRNLWNKGHCTELVHELSIRPQYESEIQ